MYLRTFSAGLLAIGLAACGVGETPEPEGDKVDCAIGAGAEFANVCTLEWIGDEVGQKFLIHHPEGGFRRFSVNEDASGVIALDGAENAIMQDSAVQGAWQFSVDGDQYRVPIPAPSGA
ncbi:hypothetical protein INR77_10710 [Erythrobacter sp. SCSIO 43205]|uniref:hypothetical protein n=1 Tax=Erythrobacter sp. SCSIO 43205 TaxID=2779361 RepID=UPI001CA95FAA|nr:hypothetical protein [Erythrobacter sp. SCSIO 43205]UAB77282.1 hypothetical protein INR77_10710 [Erythrobacter sp. SCSIO 43205]